MEWIIVALVVMAVVIAVVAGTAYFMQRDARKRRELREGFGPEHHRTMAQSRNRAEAETELKARRERASSFQLRPLPSADAARFSVEWRMTQERFVDDPKAAIADADRLVQEVMRARGYPMSNFEQGAADISVDHPHVVQNYRLAHQISQANERGEAGTEELRQGFVHYRALFAELLETEPAPAGTARR